ncbi:hypothetical protein [Fibrobacter sp.]|uniref:hypothetical protein n=1 Tax=Fibrobacter sp. TaxID=35828 RepID=UPI00388D6080
METEYLDIHIYNDGMISLSDLADSMNAVAAEFKDFCNARERNCNAELKVKEIRKGSIELLLVSTIPVILPIAENFNTIMEFGTHIKNVFTALSAKSKDRESISLSTLENVKRIVAPTARDSGGRTEFSVCGNGNTVNIYNFDPAAGRNISESAQYVEDMVRLPEKNVFVQRVLHFSQIRDSKGNVGDRAVIEEFAKTPKKVIYVDPDFKSAVISSKENIFDYMFVVDVEVCSVNGSVAAYRVLKFHERFKIDED